MTDRMHENHDLDLLSAFAEGRLTDTQAAEELVASCRECAEVYHSHRTVLEAVAHAPQPALTELEGRRLREAVWSEIGAASATPDVSKPATPGWYRLLGAAAALAVVVGAAGVLIGGLSQSDETGTTAAIEAAATTSSDEELRPLAHEPEGATDTTAATADTMMSEETSEADGDTYADATDSGGEPPPPAYTAADLVPALDAFLHRYHEGETEIDPDFQCDEVAGDDESIEAAEAASVDEEPVWFVVLRRADGTEAAEAILQANCELVPTSE